VHHESLCPPSIAAVGKHETGVPTERKPPFHYSAWARVGFSDTDAQGIVYYGRYLPYFDTARVEYLRNLALLGAERGGGHEFVMRACSIEYHAPAEFDDLVEVFVRLARLGRTSATYEFAAYRAVDDVLMVTATQTLVLIDPQHRRAVPIPNDYRRRVAAFEGKALAE
jgi:acyl-CoA thioester hydrolase